MCSVEHRQRFVDELIQREVFPHCPGQPDRGSTTVPSWGPTQPHEHYCNIMLSLQPVHDCATASPTFALFLHSFTSSTLWRERRRTLQDVNSELQRRAWWRDAIAMAIKCSGKHRGLSLTTQPTASSSRSTSQPNIIDSVYRSNAVEILGTSLAGTSGLNEKASLFFF